ncbi:hypothetical protein E9993_01570 [Labilibacter sediminis]|nr:hypothetical protein E9993_01570 [Labilibacter sediminis]
MLCDLWNFIGVNTSEIQALTATLGFLSTIILVGITAYYTIITKKILNTTTEDFKINKHPFVNFETIKIENIDVGSIIDDEFVESGATNVLFNADLINKSQIPVKIFRLEFDYDRPNKKGIDYTNFDVVLATNETTRKSMGRANFKIKSFLVVTCTVYYTSIFDTSRIYYTQKRVQVHSNYDAINEFNTTTGEITNKKRIKELTKSI